MAMNVTPFQSTDEFTMAGFNGKISDINSGVDNEITSALSGFARIETGSYVGTGEYGASNPNTLTFGFEPKALAIFYSNGTIAHNNTSAEDRPAIGYVSSLTAEYSQGLFFAYNSSPSQSAMYAKKSGNTIWWYALSDAATQFNSNATYYYIAIG